MTASIDGRHSRSCLNKDAAQQLESGKGIKKLKTAKNSD
jgi:hypothetical protein